MSVLARLLRQQLNRVFEPTIDPLAHDIKNGSRFIDSAPKTFIYVGCGKDRGASARHGFARAPAATC